MKLILLGAPGAGKGTQAEKISEQYGIPTVSTGNIIRAALKNGTEMGKKAKSYIDAGELVPDDVVIGIIKERLNEPDCQDGYILDGFPRTIPQAEALDNILAEDGRKIDRAVDIVVSEDKLVERLAYRRVCAACKLSYNLKHSNIGDCCPVCGGSLIMREDDKPKVIAARMAAYHRDTEPLIEYYRNARKLVKVNSEEVVADTFANILAALEIKGV